MIFLCDPESGHRQCNGLKSAGKKIKYNVVQWPGPTEVEPIVDATIYFYCRPIVNDPVRCVFIFFVRFHVHPAAACEFILHLSWYRWYNHSKLSVQLLL